MAETPSGFSHLSSVSGFFLFLSPSGRVLMVGGVKTWSGIRGDSEVGYQVCGVHISVLFVRIVPSYS